MFKEITCDQVRLDDAARAPADIARVLASCRRRSEPVYIEIPRGVLSSTLQRFVAGVKRLSAVK